MKLEDFFSQRTNYVEPNAPRIRTVEDPRYPVATPEDMEETFARAKKFEEIAKKTQSKPIVQKINEQERPVDVNVRTEDILDPVSQTDFTSQYQDIQPPPSMETEEEPKSIVDAEEEIDKMLLSPEPMRSPSSGGDSNLWYFLPAALGALTGNVVEGFDASSQAINQARTRQEKLDDQNTALQQKLKLLSARRQATTSEKEGRHILVNEGGKPIIKYVKDAIDKEAFIKQAGDDGRDERQRKAQEFQEKMKMTERQNKAFEDFVKPNSPFSESTQNMKMAVSAMKLLNDGGPIAESGIPSLMARGIFKEKGVLTEQDVQRVGGDPALLAKYNRTLSRALTGTLTEADREDIKVVLKVGYQEEVDRMKQQAQRYSKARKALGTDVSDILNSYVQESIEPMPGIKPRVLPARQRDKAAKGTNEKPKAIKQNGTMYYLNEKTGQYE